MLLTFIQINIILILSICLKHGQLHCHHAAVLFLKLF